MDRKRRRGALLVITAGSILVFLGLAALVIDLGMQRVVDTELQVAVDAAAAGAVGHLDRTRKGSAAARDAALRLAAMNGVRAAGPIRLDRNDTNAPEGDVVLGNYDLETGVFRPSTDPTLQNAVKVRHDTVLSTTLGLVTFGVTELRVKGDSIAVRDMGGAGSVDCYIPLGVPQCMFDDWEPGELQDLVLKLNPPGIDNTGWAGIGGHPSTRFIREQLEDCAPGESRVGDEVNLDNGVNTAALNALAEAVSDSEDLWDEEAFGALPEQMKASSIDDYGHVLAGPLLVFDSKPSFCTAGGKFTGSADVVGFAWGAVYDVRAGGPAEERTVHMRIDRLGDRVIGGDGGGPDYGITSEGQGVLVQ